ncbi:MAG: clostripain-related cysteine peptidase, partial [Promethearchaeota archaeon]
MKKYRFLILFALFTSLIFGFLLSINSTTVLLDRNNSNENKEIIENDPLESANKKWTFMVYVDADCNLEDAGIDDVNEMETVGSDSNINILVQMDRIPGYDSSNGDWTGAKRYYITKDYSGSTISSSVIQNLGEVNMGSPSTLSSFIQWGKSNYPADYYGLI